MNKRALLWMAIGMTIVQVICLVGVMLKVWPEQRGPMRDAMLLLLFCQLMSSVDRALDAWNTQRNEKHI